MYINILKISLYKNNSIYFFYNIRCIKKNNGYNYLCTCYENCTLPLSIGFGVDFCLYCVIVSLVCDCYLIFVGVGGSGGDGGGLSS